ncbi:MAG: prepilin-type N-terminal cleavage/methylation domain-containing protein [Candidatus Margulisiibacteriota bacterium]|nr:prepilin-type N-terminal cleavage/methylation domain-containing protein [Candidatus Margulisiibacteriota bacterium]
MNRKAFSLIELIVVLGLIVVLAGVSMIALGSLGPVRVDAAAKRLAADLKYAQNLALTTSKWYGVSFEADPVNLYTIYITDGVTDTVIKDPSALQNDFSIDISNEYSGVIIDSVYFDGGNKIEFHPLGYPYDDKNGSPLVNTGTVSVEFGGTTKTVIIIPNTGKISAQ